LYCRSPQAAEKLNSDAVLKGHGFIRAAKSNENGPALAAEGWLCSHPDSRANKVSKMGWVLQAAEKPVQTRAKGAF